MDTITSISFKWPTPKPRSLPWDKMAPSLENGAQIKVKWWPPLSWSFFLSVLCVHFVHFVFAKWGGGGLTEVQHHVQSSSLGFVFDKRRRDLLLLFFSFRWVSQHCRGGEVCVEPTSFFFWKTFHFRGEAADCVRKTIVFRSSFQQNSWKLFEKPFGWMNEHFSLSYRSTTKKKRKKSDSNSVKKNQELFLQIWENLKTFKLGKIKLKIR